MTTVSELIQYLQQLPPETDVRVVVGVHVGDLKYSTFEALQLPQGFSSTNIYHFSPNNTMEYSALIDNVPTLWIGRI
jgi:hypothetical protein